ncbi:fatty acid desaturase family protein [Psychrobacter sp. DM8]|uniref:fatty acid desaturase family protein n=1 Tax=Psychrobacter sp. DM8 TaxID=3440636 RepID=UPI003F506A72
MRLLSPMFSAQSALPTASFSPVDDKLWPQKPYPTLSAAPLSKAQTKAMADELDALYKEVMASLGLEDARYIQRIYSAVVYSETLARAVLSIAAIPASRRKQLGLWLLGTSLLSFSKILNNMELGHNVMHGQYDWMGHPHLNSQKFDWDIVCPAPLWQHSHNYLHHTFTNIVGRDHDVGYHLIRVTDEQSWTPSDRNNLLSTAILALGFEWAVAFHDIQISVDEYANDARLVDIMTPKSQALFSKIKRQVGKDYVAFPALSGLVFGTRSAMMTVSGNVTANLVRNVWTWAVIFCGHFTEQAHIYTHLDDHESRGDWYTRQILGSSNLTGRKWFHILTGHLSHQIEHHIYPDMPANRYTRIAPQVQEICKKYGLPYNTGSFGQQLKQVIKRIHHFSKPSAAEWQSYLTMQAVENKEVTKAVTTARGLSKYLPPVMRNALFYA